MSEIKERESLEAKDAGKTELGKAAEKMAASTSEIGRQLDTTAQLSNEDLNEPVEEAAMPEINSLDCRSECKYNTGERWKYADYGFSD